MSDFILSDFFLSPKTNSKVIHKKQTESKDSVLATPIVPKTFQRTSILKGKHAEVEIYKNPKTPRAKTPSSAAVKKIKLRYINDSSLKEVIIIKLLSKLNFLHTTQIYSWNIQKETLTSNNTLLLQLEKCDETLFDFLKNKKLSFHQLRSILFQIIFTLYYLRSLCKFVHNDLHLRNILVKKLSSPKHLYYQFDDQQFTLLDCSYLIKLSDFGSSSLQLPDGRLISSDKGHFENDDLDKLYQEISKFKLDSSATVEEKKIFSQFKKLLSKIPDTNLLVLLQSNLFQPLKTELVATSSVTLEKVECVSKEEFSSLLSQEQQMMEETEDDEPSIPTPTVLFASEDENTILEETIENAQEIFTTPNTNSVLLKSQIVELQSKLEELQQMQQIERKEFEEQKQCWLLEKEELLRIINKQKESSTTEIIPTPSRRKSESKRTFSELIDEIELTRNDSTTKHKEQTTDTVLQLFSQNEETVFSKRKRRRV